MRSGGRTIIPRYAVGGPTRTPTTPGEGIPGFQKSLHISAKGGGAFHPISENFSVNQATGTLSLAIPIRTSPTRGGFGPDLALSYDSGAGNGPFGLGWNLGLPAVQRKTSHGVPEYNEDLADGHNGHDELALSGADIVPVMVKADDRDDSFIITAYRPRIDSQDVRIEKWTSKKDAGEVHWRTISGDNVTCIYGSDDTSRIFDLSGGRKRIHSWLLSRSYEAHGNAIEYVYKQEDGHDHGGSLWEKNRTTEGRCRQKYLKKIQYGNRTPNRDMNTWSPSTWPTDWMFTVLFDYGEHNLHSPTKAEDNPWPVRADPFSVGTAGFEVRTYRLCRRILMFHHFPSKFHGVQDALVWSTTLTYDESPSASFVKSLVAAGHTICSTTTAAGGPTKYNSESLPPWTFRYTKMPEQRQYKAMKAKVANLVDVPYVVSGDNKSGLSQWIDLDGEGIPGLLTRIGNGELVYQRNNGPGAEMQFGEPETLPHQPSLSLSRTAKEAPLLPHLEDLDHNGRLDLVFSSTSEPGAPYGFYERDGETDSWSEYSDFSDMAVRDSSFDSSSSISIDLTGNGSSDMLVCAAEGDLNELIWQQAREKKGLSGYRRTSSLGSACSCPPRLRNSANVQTVTADITGDGLTDLVEITANKITYWPNHGHGNFGAAVEMANPPDLTLAGAGVFSIDRIRLIDVNGDGLTDILYLLPGGGAYIYYNQAGNSWSGPVLMSKLPRVVAPDSVFTLDLLGQGTACLCWAKSQDASEVSEIGYFDLMGGVKPNLLMGYDNGMGMQTTVTYQSSTKFYLDDKAAGLPWTTRLPSPVHCVAKVVSTDTVTGNCVTTDHAYHNGHYDPRDKQFAGFELSEQWDCESIILSAGEVYEAPVRHTRIWHSVGLPAVDRRRFSRPEPPLMSSHLVGVAENDTAEAFRALRGHIMRVEAFGLDGTAHQDSPHVVECASYNIKQLQSGRGTVRAVFQVLPRASIVYQFDRARLDNSRVTHEMVLCCNKWGDVESSLTVVYPRVAAALPPDLPADVAENQRAGNVTFAAVSFTNAVEERGNFRRPIAWRHREYEILQMDLSCHAVSDAILDVDEMRKVNFEALGDDKSPAPTSWKALRSEDRAVFTRSDLGGALDVGKLEAYSILYQHFSLALTKRKLEKIEQGRVRCDVNFKISSFLQEGGFVQMDGTDDWWVPSHRLGFTKHGQGEATTQLQCARASFYIPSIFIDAFGNASHVKFDADYLLAEEIRDTLDGVVDFENDYSHLRPFKVTDENQNVQQAVFDCLGREMALCQLGKSGVTEHANEKDSLEGYQASVTKEEVLELLKKPVEEGIRLLGKAGTRVIWCHERVPAFAVQLSRNLSHGQSDTPTITVDVAYFDGGGRVVQHVKLHDLKNNERGPWLVEGLAAVSTTGQVCSYEPYFAASADHVPLRTLSYQDGGRNATISFQDAMGVGVGTLFPDHTWTKTISNPWAITMFDKGDTVLVTAPFEDEHLGFYFARVASARYHKTWHAAALQDSDSHVRQSAERSATYSNCPVITHLGSCGLPLRQVQRAHSVTYSQACQYDVSGNAIRQFDALGRLTQRCTYDHLHRQLCSSGMDNGETWTVPDVDGNPLVSWNSRGLGFKYGYDKLRRQTQRWTQSGKLIDEAVYGESSSLDQAQVRSKNLWGRVSEEIDQSGRHIYSDYDLRGRCVEQSFQPAENYKTVRDVGDTATGEENRLGNNVFSHARAVDNFGNVVYERDAQGNETFRTFSRLGHAVKVDFHHHASKTGKKTGGEGQDQPLTKYLTDATFTADGLPLTKAYGNGACTTYEYHKLSRELIRQKTMVMSSPKRTSTKVLQDFTFVYDCMGRRTYARDAAQDARDFRGVRVAAEWDYTYDAIGQLVAAKGRAQLPDASGHLRAHSADTGRSHPSSGSQIYKYLETYRYDLAGNILSMRHAAAGLTGWTRRYMYEEPSMLASGTKDGNKVFGDRLSRTVVGHACYSVHEYKYDDSPTVKDEGEEQLDEAEDYAYVKGAGRVGCMTAFPGFSKLGWNLDNLLASSSGQRASSGSGDAEATYYVYDSNGQRVRKVTDSGGTSVRKLKETCYLPNLQLQTKADGETRWMAAVSDGSDRLALVEHAEVDKIEGEMATSKPTLVRFQVGVDMELDGDGLLISYEEYSPFGTPIYSAEASGHVKASRIFRFARYRWDKETGLYCCGARYYAAWIGRWTSPDPLGDVDGPNLYRYVANDPVNLDDHSGMSGTRKSQSGKRILSGDTRRPRLKSNPSRRGEVTRRPLNQTGAASGQGAGQSTTSTVQRSPSFVIAMSDPMPLSFSAGSRHQGPQGRTDLSKSTSTTTLTSNSNQNHAPQDQVPDASTEDKPKATWVRYLAQLAVLAIGNGTLAGAAAVVNNAVQPQWVKDSPATHFGVMGATATMFWPMARAYSDAVTKGFDKFWPLSDASKSSPARARTPSESEAQPQGEASVPLIAPQHGMAAQPTTSRRASSTGAQQGGGIVSSASRRVTEAARLGYSHVSQSRGPCIGKTSLV